MILHKEDIREYLNCKSMDDLIDACNEIYEYRYKTGVLPDKSIVRRFAKEINCDIRQMCDEIEIYAAEKLSKPIALCMIEHPNMFIKKF